MFASKMADLNLSPEPLNLVKIHFCTKNGRSEPKSGAPNSHEIAFLQQKGRSELGSGALKNGDLESAFWHLRVKLRPCLLGARVVSGRAGSAVCFFVLILNNARALRAGKNV